MRRVVLAIGLIAVLMNMPAIAADEVKIGFVNVQKVIFASKAGQKLKKEIDSLVSKKKGELKKQEKVIQDMKKKFEKEQLTLSKSQKEKKQKAFQEKVIAFRKAAAESQKEVQKKQDEFTRKALPEITNIVNDIAKKDKYTTILDMMRSGMIYTDDNTDLTERVLKQFNIRYGG